MIKLSIQSSDIELQRILICGYFLLLMLIIQLREICVSLLIETIIQPFVKNKDQIPVYLCIIGKQKCSEYFTRKELYFTISTTTTYQCAAIWLEDKSVSLCLLGWVNTWVFGVFRTIIVSVRKCLSQDKVSFNLNVFDMIEL